MTTVRLFIMAAAYRLYRQRQAAEASTMAMERLDGPGGWPCIPDAPAWLLGSLSPCRHGEARPPW